MRFDPLSSEALTARLQELGVDAGLAAACARLALGDGERAQALATGDGPALRAEAEAFARAPLHEAGGGAALGRAAAPRPGRRGRRAAAVVEETLAD